MNDLWFFLQSVLMTAGAALAAGAILPLVIVGLCASGMILAGISWVLLFIVGLPMFAWDCLVKWYKRSRRDSSHST